MLTVFGLPKAFKGRFKLIQENAIRSWAQLTPKPEIILFGDDEGTAEMAREIGARLEPSVSRNEWDTPLIGDIFARAQSMSSNETMCYLNSDIIVMSSLMGAIDHLTSHYSTEPFLGVARKTNVPIERPIEFEQVSWESHLTREARQRGKFVTYDSDIFVFRRGLWKDMPEFAIGRCYWTQWLMYKARRSGVDMIDMTNVVVNIESKHDYSHAKSTGHNARLSGVEFEANRRLFRGCKYYTTVNASHVLTDRGLEPTPPKFLVLRYTVRLEYFVYFLLKGAWYPYSMPLIWIARYAAATLRFARSLSRRVEGTTPA
jgi:hypothetical protein